MFRLPRFLRRPDPKPSPPLPTPNSIQFDPALVDRLKDDHDHLMLLYRQIKSAVDQGRHGRAAILLHDFKLAFQTHVMVENVRFYVYLQQQFAIDWQITEFLSDIRKEMDGIARRLVRFVARFRSADAIAAHSESLANEFTQIGRVLVKRVETEEASLYTLYTSNSITTTAERDCADLARMCARMAAAAP